MSASAGSDPLPFPVAHATSTSKMRDQRNDENTGKELCILHLVPFGSISITRAIKKKTRKTQRGAEEKTADQMWKRGERKQRRRKRRAALHPRTQAHRQTASSTTTSESQELHFASYLMCIVRFRLSLPFHHAVLRCAPRSFAAQGGVLQNSARPSRKEKSKRKIPHGCIESQGRESKEKRFETHAQVKESMSHIRTRISYTKGKATRATAVQRACVYVGHLVCLQIAKEKVKKETSRCQ